MRIDKVVDYVDMLRMSYICDPMDTGCNRTYDENDSWCKNCDTWYEAMAETTHCVELQVPENPLFKDEEYFCPKCGKPVHRDSPDDPIVMYCRYCGKAINWF